VVKALGGCAQAQVPSRAHSGATRQFQARVLVAEDNPVNETVERLMMAKLGVETLVAENGQVVVDTLFKDRNIDLILMDMQMPVLDGIEATRMIREQEKEHDWSPVPIIAMTASALQRDRDACKAAGMNDFLSKPVRRQDLDHLFAQWLPRNRQRQSRPE
jgi:CheY-like chemotaxis protein